MRRLHRLHAVPAVPDQPERTGAVPDTADGVQLGLLTAALATTAVSSLPLQQTAGTTEHLLASAPLTVSATAATLTDTSAFQPTTTSTPLS